MVYLPRKRHRKAPKTNALRLKINDFLKTKNLGKPGKRNVIIVLYYNDLRNYT